MHDKLRLQWSYSKTREPKKHVNMFKNDERGKCENLKQNVFSYIQKSKVSGSV